MLDTARFIIVGPDKSYWTRNGRWEAYPGQFKEGEIKSLPAGTVKVLVVDLDGVIVFDMTPYDFNCGFLNTSNVIKI